MQASPPSWAAISDSSRTRVGSASALNLRASCSASPGLMTSPVSGPQHSRGSLMVGMPRFCHVALTSVDATGVAASEDASLTDRLPNAPAGKHMRPARANWSRQGSLTQLRSVMRNSTRLAAVGGIAAVATALLAAPAQATPGQHSDPVFVQTDNVVGNTIVAYDRAG